jgi:signal recognition particle receptor subunit beta
MAEFGREGAEVRARIVYWGIEGSGKSTNVQVIQSKLRPDHRGELRAVPTRLDPTLTYDVLPIELGQIGGVRTRIQIITVPGAAEHAPTRKQLLDQVDGIVFVVDTRRERIEENLSSLEELRGALSSYGRALEEIPLVVQYNRRDQSDPYVLEELHRKLSMRSVAAFEAVATSGTAVLQTLTTISKRVIRHLRERVDGDRAPEATTESAPSEPEPAQTTPAEPAPVPAAPPPGVSQLLETAVTSPAEPAADLDGSVAESAAVDPAILYDEDHPDRAAIEATAAEAEATFEPSFQQVTVELEAPTRVELDEDVPPTMGAIRIDSVGQTQQTGSGAVRIPIVLRDETGRSLAISLMVEIDVSKVESPD